MVNVMLTVSMKGEHKCTPTVKVYDPRQQSVATMTLAKAQQNQCCKVEEGSSRLGEVTASVIIDTWNA